MLIAQIRRIMIRIFLAMLFALLLIGYTQAATITVCPSGCDYKSIQTAVYAARPNDTIEVHSGTYNESVVLTKGIMFKGVDTGSGEPIVNGDLYKNGFNSVLHGFSFQSISSGVPYSKDMAPNTTVYLVENAIENPSPSKGIAALNKITKTNPRDAWAWFRKGWLLNNAQRFDESLDAYNESLKLDPYFSTAWNNKALALDQQGKHDEAIQTFNKAIQLSPNDAAIWNNKGNALEKLDHTSEADAAFTKAKELGYNMAQTQANLTLYVLDGGVNGPVLPGAAVNAYDAGGTSFTGITDSKGAVRINGKPGTWRFTISKEGYETVYSNYNVTETHTLATYLQRNSQLQGTTISMTIYVHDGNLTGPQLPGVQVSGQDASNNDFKKQTDSNGSVVINGHPGTWQFTFSKDGYEPVSLNYNVTGTQYTAAYLQRNNAYSWNSKGIALYNQGKYNEAIKAYDEAIKIDPKYKWAWANKGGALKSSGKYNESIQAYDEALKIDQNYTFAWNSKVDALVKIGKSAVEPLIQALKYENSTVRYKAAVALGELRDNRAVEPLIQALKDNDSIVRENAAVALGELRDNRAVELLIQALQDQNSSVRLDAAFALGRINDTRAVEPLIQTLRG